MIDMRNKNRFLSMMAIPTLVAFFGGCSSDATTDSAANATSSLSGSLDGTNGDETHFSVSKIKNIDISNATNFFVADRGEVARLEDVFTTSSDGTALFKVTKSGKITEISMLGANGRPFDSPQWPRDTIKGNGFVVMGFIERREGDFHTGTEPPAIGDRLRETIVVRESDGAVYYVGEGIELYPQYDSAPMRALYGPVDAISTTKDGDVFYSNSKGRLIKISGFGFEGSDAKGMEFIGSKTDTSSFPIVNFDDGLILLGQKAFIPKEDGTYHIVNRNIYEDINQTNDIRKLMGVKAINHTLAIYDGTWKLNKETMQPQKVANTAKNDEHITLFTFEIDESRENLEPKLYGRIHIDGKTTSVFEQGWAFHRLGNTVFLLSNAYGVFELENEENDPKHIGPLDYSEIIKIGDYLFVLRDDKTLVRLSAEGNLEPVRYENEYSVSTFRTFIEGMIIVEGTDLSDSTPFAGYIRPELNDISQFDGSEFNGGDDNNTPPPPSSALPSLSELGLGTRHRQPIPSRPAILQKN